MTITPYNTETIPGLIAWATDNNKTFQCVAHHIEDRHIGTLTLSGHHKLTAAIGTARAYPCDRSFTDLVAALGGRQDLAVQITAGVYETPAGYEHEANNPGAAFDNAKNTAIEQEAAHDH